jgi:DNA-binding response OmpR family regulator
MAGAGWKILTAESANEARHLLQEKPDAALLDYMLPDGNGVELGVKFLQSVPHALVIVMTGPFFPLRRKPFAKSTIFRFCESLSWPRT